MKLRNKAILGASVLLGGSVLLYATVTQIMNDKQSTVAQPVKTVVAPKEQAENFQPLTADIQTEKTILEQKQREREARVEAQERNAQKYLTEQQRIDAQALAKSRAENQLYVREDEIVHPVVTPRPVETIDNLRTAKALTGEVEKKTSNEPEFIPVTPNSTIKSDSKTATTKSVQNEQQKRDEQKRQEQKKREETNTSKTKTEQKPQQSEQTARPTSYQVKSGEGLIQLSKRYNVPVSVLAQANNLNPNSELRIGQKITIPSEQQAKRIEQEAKQREQEKQQYQQAQQKLKDARKEAQETDTKGNFGVQITLASDQKKADDIVQKLKAAGYQAKTSQTSKGVRVVVGPEKSKQAALALKDKINADPKLNTNNAWVLEW